ncbi:hypothetical protein [Streptosporangium sp. V21-05]|uniref:hypothetical protein n=1 Tax=Streptosporangium sp. V21-05 TaxID=3446115 RepID=UPI003F537F85
MTAGNAFSGFTPNPSAIKRIYASSLGEMIDTVRAAHALGLGVVLANQLEQEPQGGYSEGWMLTLFESVPLVGSESLGE